VDETGSNVIDVLAVRARQWRTNLLGQSRNAFLELPLDKVLARVDQRLERDHEK
jgi:hypothetical protein